jgi:polyhydroxyalkanoate synthesis regulator protein
MQGMMSAYMDQSKNVFMQMQDQLQNQTKNIFAGFTFPGFPGQPAAPEKDEGKKS